MAGAELAATITEEALLQAVQDLACTFGWIVYHTRDSRGSNPGFPDLVLAHQGPQDVSGEGAVIFAELKTATGKLTVGQRLWLHVLEVAGAEVHVWRPDDWDQIVARLRCKGAVR